MRQGSSDWNMLVEALTDRAPLIARQVPVNRSQLDTAVAACAVDGIARRLSTSEIAEVRQSLSTAAGQKFWEAARITDRPLEGCY